MKLVGLLCIERLGVYQQTKINGYSVGIELERRDTVWSGAGKHIRSCGLA